MKFKFSWASCILSGNPSWGRGGKNIRVALDYEKVYNCYCSSKFYSDWELETWREEVRDLVPNQVLRKIFCCIAEDNRLKKSPGHSAQAMDLFGINFSEPFIWKHLLSTYCVPDIMFGPYYDSKPIVTLLLGDLNCKGKEQMHSRKLKKVKE